ncbi:MAG: U32 family peptidase [Bacteroidia bacterium]|nr:U32 family peptidase [Bacteroidia bacterium]
MKTVRKIELLAPAKNKEIGKEAILHGADAVYIGISGFSARAAAGNSMEDIAELIEFAHQYNVRVYVALNTILYDNELPEVEKLIWELYRVNTDAIIVQDMGALQLNLPPIPFHASTQTDNRTVEKVQFLEKAGFSQVVLARELSIDEISEISSKVNIPLEVFVHGALCVSYSGQCYISQAVTERSANRGECAQMCRLPFDLEDADGKTIRKNTHLLSLKDFNQHENLEKLLDAGVSSLKIEGRLKDVTYVKNVVSAYRQRLDEIFTKRPEFMRASSGKSTIDFTPNLSKSFNRGFTDYFSNGRQHDIWSFDSPKSMGELVGTVKSVNKNWLSLKTKLPLNNGDGLCFIDKNGLNGFRVNRVEGDRVFPAETPNINIGTKVYRNYDHDFETRLTKKTAERKISASIAVREIPIGFVLQISDEDSNSYSFSSTFEKQPAQKPQYENIRTQFSKTGNTIFEIVDTNIDFSQDWFLPSSLLGEWRKKLILGLLSVRKINYKQERKQIQSTSHAFPEKELTYLGNVSNSKSRLFYTQHQSKILQPAFEQVKQKNVPLMFTKHCVKYVLGWCPRETKDRLSFREPFFLVNQQNRFKLTFNCKACVMEVIEDK